MNPELSQQMLTFFIGFPILIGLIFLIGWIITIIRFKFDTKSTHSGNTISHKPLTIHEWTLDGPDPGL